MSMKGSMCVAVVVAISCAFVCGFDLHPYDHTAMITFLESDRNLDFLLTFDEMIDTFRKYDANNDSIETRDEYTRYICKSTPMLYEFSHKLFDEYDNNKDNVLDLNDYWIFFNNMDKDNDGIVDDIEFIITWTPLFEKYEAYHSNGTLMGDCAHLQPV